MSLKFDEAFDKLMEKSGTQGDLEAPKEYPNDIKEISRKINKAFYDINSIFQGKIMNLVETSITHPDHHRVLHVKMPFKITAIKEHQTETYKLKTCVLHPVVRSGYVIPDLIVALFGADLKRALGGMGQVTCESGKTYTLSLGMSDKTIHGAPLFEIKNSDTKGLSPLYKFELFYTFSNDANIYFGTGSQFWVMNGTFLENSQKDINKVFDLLVHLNGNIPQVYDAIFVTTYNKSVFEMTLEALKNLISVSDNSERLSFVYNKLMDFKQSDSVDLAELMALFNIH